MCSLSLFRCSPQIIIPDDCSDVHCRLLVLDLGHLIVNQDGTGTRSAPVIKPVPRLADSTAAAAVSEPASSSGTAPSPGTTSSPYVDVAASPVSAADAGRSPGAAGASGDDSAATTDDDGDDGDGRLMRHDSQSSERFVTPPSSPEPATEPPAPGPVLAPALPAPSTPPSAPASAPAALLPAGDGGAGDPAWPVVEVDPGLARLPYDRYFVHLRDVQV